MNRRLGQKGAALVEFGVLSLLLLVMVLGIIEFGFLWLQSHYTANAAREGAAVASRFGNPASAEAEAAVAAAVRDYLEGLYGSARVAGGCCAAGDFIAVEVVPETIAGPPAVAAVRVNVTVQSRQFWDPLLWGILPLLGGEAEEVGEIAETALFVVRAGG